MIFSIAIKGGQVSLSKRQQEIFEVIKKNPEISRKDLALLQESEGFYEQVNIGSGLL